MSRYKSDGSLVYLGRKDLQAKIHGQRIELQEIEWQIRNHGTFLECVVEVISLDLLIAFVVVEAPQQKSISGFLPPDTLPRAVSSGLNRYLESILPIHMVPTVYVPAGNIPRTTSGKADRRQLRKSIKAAVDSYRFVGRHTKQPLATSAQKHLAELWADVMSIPVGQIGADDTISMLSGDSVTVIRIISGARTRGLGLQITGDYQHSTLEQMANLPGTANSRTRDDHLPPPPFSLIGDLDMETMVRTAAKECKVSNDSVVDVYPCAPVQESLMITSTKSPGAYFDQEVFRLAQGTSVPPLIEILQIVWARHLILRTRIFLDEHFRSFQVVLKEKLEVPMVQERDLRLYLRKEAEEIPGYGDRLSRCALVQSDMHTHLVFSRHHAVFDGWSRGLLLEDIHQMYKGIPESQSSPGAYSLFVSSCLDVQRCSEAEGFWKELLTDVTASSLPQLKESCPFEANQRYTLDVPSLTLATCT